MWITDNDMFLLSDKTNHIKHLKKYQGFTSNVLVLQGDQAVCSYAMPHNKVTSGKKNGGYQEGNSFQWAKSNIKGFLPTSR